MPLASLLLFFLTFVELNCENLFDCKDDPLTEDEAFTPTGLYRWTPARYWKKVNNIAREILSCGEKEDGTTAIPDLVALTEVENDSVLFDLTRRSLLHNAHYEYITTNSPDVRGMDVALLYSPLTFSVINSYPIRIIPLKDMRPTRDILYVKGRTAHSDTLHIFVVHFPSRLGGEFETRKHRQHVAERLNVSLDSLLSISPEANIIIAGDFNDPPQGRALKGLEERSLVDISAEAKGKNGALGTYKYKGEWENIDHIFVSQPLSEGATCRINDINGLLTKDEDYGSLRPNRNFYQIKWMDGFSDHLPLVAEIPMKGISPPSPEE